MSPLHSFSYDAFQEQAINAVRGNTSVIVAAPTGSGKTVIADHVIDDALSRGQHVIYTAPIKALSNQKYRDFSEEYSDLVGIITGDVSINPHAPIRIMTTEIYRNTLLDQPDDILDAAWIIFDEVHYLDDEERGTVWEESIILTPRSTRILCLSATVPNVQEIADWMEQVLDRQTTVIIETERPVPLHFKFQCQGKIYDSFRRIRTDAYRGFSSGRRRELRHRKKIIPNRLTQLISHIIANDELPCIYFAFGRRLTEELAEKTLGFQLVSPEERLGIEHRYVELCRNSNLVHEASAQRMQKFIRHGIAFHHAGMLPSLKEVIEKLFTEKCIKFIYTTETFALGINMPARCVVFDSLRKFYRSGFDTLKTRDFYQMAGRAGRRGMDEEGSVYTRLVPTRMKLHEVEECLFGDPRPVRSQFNASYATLLNLYARYGEKIIEIYPRTLSCFQSSKRQRKRARLRLSNRLRLLETTGCIRRKKLTGKGEFARWMFGHELYMSEMFDSGLLDRLSIHELCFALSCLVYEPKKGSWTPRRPPKKFVWVVRDIQAIYRTIHDVESRYGIDPAAPPPHPHLGHAVDAWSKGAEFAEAVMVSGLDEGELVRYFRMIIQLLRQLINAPYTSETLRKSARDARKLIDRDVVDAERQLRA